MKDLLVAPVVTDGLVPALIMCAELAISDDVSRINQLTEVISESRLSLQEDLPQQEEMSVQEKRNLQLKLAKVHLELQTLRDELEEAVAECNFSKAQELKDRQTELNQTKDGYQEVLQRTQIPSVKTQEEKNDPATLMKCLTIAYEMLQSPNINKIDSTVRTLIDDVINPCIQNPDPGVRNIGIKTLGVCCLLDLEVAQRYLVLFLQICQMDLEAIKISSACVIFDLLLRFGLEQFNIPEVKDIGKEGEDEEEDEDNTQNKKDIMSLLTDMLDTEVNMFTIF